MKKLNGNQHSHMQESKEVDHRRELLLKMETLTQVWYSGKHVHILTEITNPQRLIMDSLKISPVKHSYN